MMWLGDGQVGRVLMWLRGKAAGWSSHDVVRGWECRIGNSRCVWGARWTSHVVVERGRRWQSGMHLHERYTFNWLMSYVNLWIITNVFPKGIRQAFYYNLKRGII